MTGADAILGVSMAVARAASAGLPLYQYLGGVRAFTSRSGQAK